MRKRALYYLQAPENKGLISKFKERITHCHPLTLAAQYLSEGKFSWDNQ